MNMSYGGRSGICICERKIAIMAGGVSLKGSGGVKACGQRRAGMTETPLCISA